MTKRAMLVWVGIVTLIGLAVRLYQIGADSFWIDEVGVMRAAEAQTLPQLFDVTRTHILAMPLDYIIAWGLRKFGSNEGLMRLPEAIWGTLSIPAAFFLFRKLRNETAAILSAFLLALSPFHIQYSQELRFYAPLVFFHLFSSWLLFSAIETPTARRWVQFTICALVGIFFHIYVFLCVVPGLLLLLTREGRHGPRLKLYFMRSMIALFIGLIAGLLFFGATNPYRVALDLFEPSLMNAVAVGLGWVPFYAPLTPDGTWLWGLACLFFEAAGIVLITREKNGWLISAAVGMQIAMVCLAPVVKGYFLSPRNLIHLLPWMLFFAAVGMEWSGRRASNLGFLKPVPWLRKPQTLSIILAGALFFSAVPALRGYYAGDKGRVREIAGLVEKMAGADTDIYVVPGNEADQFDYYLSRPLVGSKPTIPVNWESVLSGQGRDPAVDAILITGAMAPLDYQSGLSAAGFHRVYQSEQSIRYPHQIWRRPADTP